MAPAERGVLHLLDSLSIGGTERNAVRQLIELKHRGVPVQLAVLRDGPLREHLDRAGIPVHRLVVPSFYSLSLLREARRFGRIARENRIGLLHAHDRWSNVFAGVARMLGTAIPSIVSKRWDSRADPWPMRTAARFAFRVATRVVANSEAVARSAALHEKVPASKIVVIPNFVDDAMLSASRADLRAETRRELGLRPGDQVIVCVANLRPVKHHALLLEAMAAAGHALPDLVLVLVGDGPDRLALERQAGELGLAARVRFIGQRMDAWRYHAAGDLSVLSSVSEGFPNALVEAQALGVPVVATAVGGVAEVVEDGVTGLLVLEGDAGAFSNALIALFNDTDRRLAMGLAGRSAVGRRYSREAVLGLVMGLYGELGAGRR